MGHGKRQPTPSPTVSTCLPNFCTTPCSPVFTWYKPVAIQPTTRTMANTRMGVDERPEPDPPNKVSTRFCQSFSAWSKSPPPWLGFLPQGLLLFGPPG